MKLTPCFPTALHEEAAVIVCDYLRPMPAVDSVLIVNSCARGQAVPESDLDFAILVKPRSTAMQISNIESEWRAYSQKQSVLIKYTASHPFAHLHLDVIDGNYKPMNIEKGEPIDYFEVEIGNQIHYSAPMETAGLYFKELRDKWLPYYADTLRLERLTASRSACEYDLDHIPSLVERALHFHAFDTLWQAFQKYLKPFLLPIKHILLLTTNGLKNRLYNG